MGLKTPGTAIDQKHLLPRLAAFGAVVLWGVSFVATKAALLQVSPITLVFSRFALGTAFLILILKLQRKSMVPPRDALPALALMGFLGVVVHQLLQVFGLTLTTAVRTGWLIGLIPIWTAILSAIFLHERFGMRKVAGLFVGAVGAFLVITRGEFSMRVLALPRTLGDFLIVASTINWATYTIVSRKMLQRLGSIRTTAAAMFIGWAMFIPIFLAVSGVQELSRLTLAGWGYVLFLGVGCSGAGYLLWCVALERLEASKVAVWLYLEPLVTVVVAVPVLAEPVGWLMIGGGLLVLAGVFIVQRK